MNIKRFIDRPILSAVISVVIMFVGVIGFVMLPVEQFPEIAPPTIAVSATYSGASAQTVQKSVVVPLEEAINGVENMLYMTSSASSTGTASVVIYFRQGANPDMAMVNVQNAVATAESLLPSEVTKSGVRVYKRQPANLKIFAIYSPDNSFDDIFIANYLKINVEPRLARVTGVGEVNVMGADYAMRIWLDPQKMAQYDLMPSDISTVLAQQNIESSTGTLGSESNDAFQIDIRYRGRYEDEEDFRNLVVKSTSNGEILYLRDVATIEMGAQNYNYISGVNGVYGRTCMISQTAGSNANEVVIGVDKELEEIRKDLPKGLVLEDLMNTKDFLDASFKNVFWTLIEAVMLVILVVYIFLQNFRSTLIPTAAIIVSLIGTFAFIYAMGFSLNLLTLFALVLVIGTVVDDAIVVVEAVQGKFDGGERSPYKATIYAMREITSALITTTVVFMAVFIPVSFMGGTTGKFYTQFGLTMAVAVAISTFNAMTLSPALCALIMTPHRDVEGGEKASFSSRFHFAFNAGFERLVNRYQSSAAFFLRHKLTAALMIIVACGGLYYMMGITKTALVPNEDMGSLFLNVQTPPGYSQAETHKVMQQLEKRISTVEEIKIFSMITGGNRVGASGSNAGMFIIRLKDWADRPDVKTQGIEAVVQKLYAVISDVSAADVMIITPPMITGYGASNGFELNIQDKMGGEIEDLERYTQEFIRKLSAREEVARAQTSFNTKYPQYLLEVDAAQCLRRGVSPSDVLETISGYVGSSYASNLNKYSKLYRVILQAHSDQRLDLAALESMYVRSSSGEMSPVTQYVNIEKVYGAQNLSRFNLFPSISVNGTPADGYSSGQTIQAIREVAAETLPVGYGYEFGGMSREESSSTDSTVIIFVICIVFVYLILCALYESIFIPFAVILSVPFGLLGSFLFANLFGVSNDIYMQTGLIMLIGLLAKTAILLTEYASERRAQGMSVTEAALTAAKVRLRPILMTTLTLIFGMLPLMFASGVGANGNISLGVTVVGGMLIGTVALIFIVPSLFVIFKKIEERVIPKRELPEIDN